MTISVKNLEQLAGVKPDGMKRENFVEDVWALDVVEGLPPQSKILMRLQFE